MIKITRIWVAVDSMNHAVRETISGLTAKSRTSIQNIARSNADDSAPMIRVKRDSEKSPVGTPPPRTRGVASCDLF